MRMTHHKNYDNESQDARRHTKHNATHPEEKSGKNQSKAQQNPSKPSDSPPPRK